MKRFVTLALSALLVGSLLNPASAGAKKQVVEGSIAAPAPFTDDSGCYAGLHRRLAVVTQEQVNGLIGYHFDIDPATWGGKFKLEPTGGQGDVDLDIYFYQQLGTVEQVATDPQGAGSPAVVQINTREPGGEVGTVPPDFTKVIVCMYGGQQGAGAGATFTYTATPPKKKK